MDFSGLYLKELGYMLDWWLPLEQFWFCSILENPENFIFIGFESKFQIWILMSFSRKCFEAFLFLKILFLIKVCSSLKVFCRKILLLTQASHETLADLLQLAWWGCGSLLTPLWSRSRSWSIQIQSELWTQQNWEMKDALVPGRAKCFTYLKKDLSYPEDYYSQFCSCRK